MGEGSLVVLFGTGTYSGFGSGFPDCRHAAASALSLDLLNGSHAILLLTGELMLLAKSKPWANARESP